jgi:hypothetical protein
MESFPLGWYTLPDGREVYGMNEFEIRAAARDAMRKQLAADQVLERRLASLRQDHDAPKPGPIQKTLF